MKDDSAKKKSAPKIFQADAAPPIFPTSPTVASVLDWYAQNLLNHYSPVALHERKRLWELFKKHCGAMLVEDARGADLLEFLTELKGIKSNHTRRRVKATICKPFNEAAATGLIGRNPFACVKIRQGKRGRDWTPDEFQAAMRVAPPHLRRVMVFFKFSGARPGEARKLQWDQVRNDIGAIIQDEHKSAHMGHGPRRIFFNHVIVKLLAWLKRHPHKRGDKNYVFLNKIGRPWRNRALSNCAAIVRERAGLRKEFKMHGGRHLFATNAILNGVDVATLSELLSHRNLATTSIYLHLANKRAHLNAAMEKAVASPKPKREGQP